MIKLVITAACATVGFVVMTTIVVVLLVSGSASQTTCTPGGTGGPLPSPPPGQPGAGQIVRYLEKGGESANAAAGVVGNLEQETQGINPEESDGRGGGGIAQWSATWYHVAGPNGSQSLDAFAASQHVAANTDQAQLAFILYDLRGPYQWLATKMNRAPDPQTAATMFETGYEHCSGVTGFMKVAPGSECNDPNRRQYAVAALHAAGGGGTGTTVFVGAPVAECSPVTGPAPITSGPTGKVLASGIAEAPANAPAQVKEIIAAANQIIDKPYIWGGGHGSFEAAGYDCSGAVSYALHGAGLLSTPETSGELESFGAPGAGRSVDVYGSPGHAFLIVAGLALDTSHWGLPYAPTSPASGPRWFVASQLLQSQLSDGEHWVQRHPQGL